MGYVAPAVDVESAVGSVADNIGVSANPRLGASISSSSPH
jgi:hypothetical protein